MNQQSIQVLGSGCPTCRQLLETTKKIAKELNIAAEIEYITDVAKLVEMGVMTSPALAINGKSVLSGGGLSESDIRQALQNNSSQENDVSTGCSCGGKC